MELEWKKRRLINYLWSATIPKWKAAGTTDLVTGFWYERRRS